MKNLLLQNLQKFIHDEQMDSTFFEANEEIPYDRFIVYIGQDNHNRQMHLEITASFQELLEDVSSKKYYKVSFQYIFPFFVQLLKKRDIGSLLFMLNQLIELPGFILQEADDLIIYRYAFYSSIEDMDLFLFSTYLTTIMSTLKMFSELIEQIATSDTSLDSILKETLKLTKQFEA